MAAVFGDVEKKLGPQSIIRNIAKNMVVLL